MNILGIKYPGGIPQLDRDAAWRSVSAALSAVISRCGDPKSSYPTMNFRIVAERSSGG